MLNHINQIDSTFTVVTDEYQVVALKEYISGSVNRFNQVYENYDSFTYRSAGSGYEIYGFYGGFPLEDKPIYAVQ